MGTCTHGFPSPAQCMTCIEDDGLGAAPVPPEKITHWFTARYDGQCTACDLPIRPGQPAASTTNDRTIHGSCTQGMEISA